MLNGVTKLVVTKMDILDSFEEIQVAASYTLDGEKITHVPYDISQFGLTSNFENLDGWNSSLDDIVHYVDLPDPAKAYIEYLEKTLKVPVSMVSTGPQRRKILIK